MKTVFLAAVLGAGTLSTSAVRAQNQSETSVAAAIPRIALVRVLTTDVAKSEHFYRQTFNMQPGPGSTSREHVLVFADGAVPVVVIALADKPSANGDRANFAVSLPDLDPILRRATTAGGTVAQSPRAISGGERLAFIKDPDGNAIELIEIKVAHP